jgi:hypothetical protein
VTAGNGIFQLNGKWVFAVHPQTPDDHVTDPTPQDTSVSTAPMSTGLI